MTASVYRRKLAHPHDGVPELAEHLGLTPDDVRRSLARLSEMALLRGGGGDPGQGRAIGPELALQLLQARQQAELAAQQQRMEATRAAVVGLMAEIADSSSQEASKSGIRYLEGIDAIRDQIELLSAGARSEVLSFAPDSQMSQASIEAARPLNQRNVEQGIEMRTIYLDSIRHDHHAREYTTWLEGIGVHVRTSPVLPNRLTIVDRRSALVAVDATNTGAGAALVTSPGLISLLVTLFEHIWEASAPLGPTAAPGEPELLTRQQAAVLQLMAEGRTDEAIAHGLGVSTRTVGRVITGLLAHLGVRSRFQAGMRAVQYGYLSHSHPHSHPHASRADQATRSA
ncbi:helix-turn-helix transcriptional regulator [Streptomyces sp. NBC_01264]|uniref:helix-turn-helix transcriptional regulator n=1 Tax=Streptomyces sp. NBC_01264 TaxID=2903804 RepID=UPI00225A56E2|nr:LuxR C-terminal-related transcriptional regulator [Streptomyces sp. NBC_01264]MCX4779033.1 LuxR C-terminal-related transcriptional regulator [Streptomyces sp. NBC_01264]